MHARVTRRQIQPGRMDEALTIMRDSRAPMVRARKGYVQGGRVLADRNTSTLIAMTLWETEADAKAGGAGDSPLDALSVEPSVREVYEVVQM